MKRSAPLQRKKPLRAKKGLQGGGRLAPKRKRQRILKLKAPRNFPHMGRVKELGCICCRHLGLGWVPAEAHHIRDGYGAGERALDEETIPLCPWHHREGPMGEAFHAGEREWVKRHGTERELLAETRRDLGLAASLVMAG